MKKIILAFLICFVFAGAGYCAPRDMRPANGIVQPPPPPQHKPARVSHSHRHHHHPPKIYNYYPGGTVFSIRTGGLALSYGIRI